MTLRIGISARLLHNPPPGLGLPIKRLQFLESSMAHWIMGHGAMALMVPFIDESAHLPSNAVPLSDIVNLLDGLVLLDFNELIELSEGNNHLRKLLVSQLQNQLSSHHSSLLEVQKRLVELLAKFRQQQARSLLITNMAAFLRQHPKYQPADYPNRSELPQLFNQAAAIKPQAAIALDKASERQILAELVRALPRHKAVQLSDTPAASFAQQWQDEAIAARQQALKTDVENFYLRVIDHGGKLSALDYLTQQQLEWDSEIWLYQIIAEYQALPADEKQMFTIKRDEAPASSTNQLLLIRDISLSLNAQAA
jgi:hypothetical protein